VTDLFIAQDFQYTGVILAQNLVTQYSQLFYLICL